MPFVYPKNPLTLIGSPTVGEGEYKGECAAIAEFLVPGLGDVHVSQWKRGSRVKGDVSLRQGTVIATFDKNGRYIGTAIHNHAHGVAHTALYVRQTDIGVEVVHQFKGCGSIKGALIRFGGGRLPGHKSGVSALGLGTLEDDANDYYVVEL